MYTFHRYELLPYIVQCHAECPHEQQSRSKQPLNSDILTEPDKQLEDTDKQPAVEDTVCTGNDTGEVIEKATIPTQLQTPDSPVDQELPDYYNVDAINTHMDGLITV